MTQLGWHDINDELPDRTGWYLVYAPKYRGGSSTGKECIGGILFSKFNIAKNGNRSWSAESCGWNKNCVKFWMNLPEKPVCDELEEFENSKYKQLEFPFEN